MKMAAEFRMPSMLSREGGGVAFVSSPRAAGRRCRALPEAIPRCSRCRWLTQAVACGLWGGWGYNAVALRTPKQIPDVDLATPGKIL
jgi:hypothetical protein